MDTTMFFLLHIFDSVAFLSQAFDSASLNTIFFFSFKTETEIENKRSEQETELSKGKWEKCSNKDKPWVSHREKWSFKHRFTLFFFFSRPALDLSHRVHSICPAPYSSVAGLLFGFQAHSFLLSVTSREREKKRNLHAICERLRVCVS